MSFTMHEGMGGPHRFEIVVPSNDAVESEARLVVAAQFPSP